MAERPPTGIRAGLAAEVEEAWPLTRVSVGPVLRSFESRTVALLDAAEGRFVIKIDDDPLTAPGAVGYGVLGFLDEQRFRHAPRIARTSTGALGARLAQGESACVLEFVPFPPRPAPDQWHAFGRAVAGLNRLEGFTEPFAIPLAAAIDEVRARAGGHPIAGALDAVLDEIAWIADLPSDALVHGEVNCANGGVRADGTTVLLDWDQAGSAPAAVDYGYPLITQFIAESTEAVDVDAMRAFYRGYRASGGVIDADQLFACALFHALRYMWWGDTEARWRRIEFARRHRPSLVHAALG